VRESDIEGWACKLAKKTGWWHRKFKSPGKRSAPDRIFAKTGHVFFVEFKATGEDATPLQNDEHEAMDAAGLVVWVCDSREQFKTILAFEEAMLAHPG
jgi:hypothetical protein